MALSLEFFRTVKKHGAYPSDSSFVKILFLCVRSVKSALLSTYAYGLLPTIVFLNVVFLPVKGDFKLFFFPTTIFRLMDVLIRNKIDRNTILYTRASWTSMTASTFGSCSYIFLRPLAMWPGNH